MLCDACMHRTGECVDDCDYNSTTDTCKFNKTPSSKTNEWISVKGKLPPVGIYVITAAKYTTKSMSTTMLTINRLSANGKWVLSECDGVSKVTHWMALPDVPKEQENDDSNSGH